MQDEALIRMAVKIFVNTTELYCNCSHMSHVTAVVTHMSDYLANDSKQSNAVERARSKSGFELELCPTQLSRPFKRFEFERERAAATPTGTSVSASLALPRRANLTGVGFK